MSVVFIMATFVYIGIQHRRINHWKNTSQLQAVELSTLKDSVSVYKSKSGELTYKLSVVEVSHNNLKKSLELSGFEIKKLKDRDINWRKVTAALRMQLAATGHGETNVTDSFRIEPVRPDHSGGKTDTVYFSKVENWTNNFLSLYNAEIVNKRFKFDYKYQTGIDFVTEQQRKGMLVSVMLSDTTASITTGNSIFVKPKKRVWNKWWFWGAIGFGAGVIITR